MDRSFKPAPKNLVTKLKSLRFLTNRALSKIFNDQINLNILLSQQDPGLEKPIQKELVYGVLRQFYFLEERLKVYMNKSLKNRDNDIKLLILTGLYQIYFMKTPVYAVVNETVSVCSEMKKVWAKGLVNAVLRKAAHEKIPKSFLQSSLPAWLTVRLKKDFPESHQKIENTFLTKPNMSLRINTGKIDSQSYRKKLKESSIDFQSTPYEEAIILDNPQPSEELPGWSNGEVSIQDFGAVLLGRLFIDQVRQSNFQENWILDACAAPGGKHFHILEMMKKNGLGGSIDGIELNPNRLNTVLEIAGRLGHSVDIKQGDARRLDWWAGRKYTQILVDAPCTSSGTIARNPDVKILLNSKRIIEFQKQQLQILNTLWKTLAPGGRLFYCTCSLFNEENDLVVKKFLEVHPDSSLCNIDMPANTKNSVATSCGWYLLPFDNISDGFYCSAISKVASSQESL